MIRRKLIFYGRVQGVGFRYRAYHAANLYGATGWVKNCHDGSVEMELQGQEETIDKVILSIEKSSWIVIENFVSKKIPIREERGFVVKED